jgi:hypothetical protein
LNEAAEGFQDFRDEVTERLDDHDVSLDDLDDRVIVLESTRRFRDRLRWVISGR